MPVEPPASAMYPVIAMLPPEPSATFSGVSGCRKPGVMVNVELVTSAALVVDVAVTFTWTLSAVR